MIFQHCAGASGLRKWLGTMAVPFPWDKTLSEIGRAFFWDGGSTKTAKLNFQKSTKFYFEILPVLEILRQNFDSYYFLRPQKKSQAHFRSWTPLRQMAPALVTNHFLKPLAPAQCWNIIGLMSEQNYLSYGCFEWRDCRSKYRKNAISGHIYGKTKNLKWPPFCHFWSDSDPPDIKIFRRASTLR